MIPQNELRPGCAIQNPFGDGELVLRNVAFRDGKIYIDEAATTGEALQGIPLDADVLDSCGFDLVYGLSDPHYDLYKNGDVALNREYRLAFKCSDQTCTIGEPLQYLHQLQNLYFDLCGKELRMVK